MSKTIGEKLRCVAVPKCFRGWFKPMPKVGLALHNSRAKGDYQPARRHVSGLQASWNQGPRGKWRRSMDGSMAFCRPAHPVLGQGRGT